MTEQMTSSLLQRIIFTRKTVGDNLRDEKVTHLLHQEGLPSENGFTFVSVCEGCVTFGVPPQDLVNWYSDNGGIAPKKEALAKAIAQKCACSLTEPLDERSANSHGAEAHHHLELSRAGQVVVIVHPRYMKIRLFDSWIKRALALPADSLEQLATLYQM